MSCTIPPECQQILTSDPPPPPPTPPEKLIQPLNYDSHGNGLGHYTKPYMNTVSD